MPPLARSHDGFFRPGNVTEVQRLVTEAQSLRIPVRVRGSGHSVAGAIITPDFATAHDRVVAISLDRMRAVRITPDNDGAHALVEVEAGCHLGRDPYDPSGTSTWPNSLNYQLQAAGYALDDLGGITHQTVAGFMMTGSAGGSTRHTLADDILRIQLVNGLGELVDLRRDDPDDSRRALFFAAGVSVGLLGIVVKVWFRVARSYNVVGKEVTSAVATAAVDLLGPGDAQRPSLESFLRSTPYSRLLWWPQHNFERVQIWQAERQEPSEGFQRKPFLEFGRSAQVTALAGSLFYTVIGNLDDLTVVPSKLHNWYRQLDETIDGDDDENACDMPSAADAAAASTASVDDVMHELQQRFSRAIERHPHLNDGCESERADVRTLLDEGDDNDGPLHNLLSRVLIKLFKLLIDGSLDSWLGRLLGKWLKDELPLLIDNILDPFVPEGTKTFQECWMCALPMDNQMDDQLWPTDFTELWIPARKTEAVMKKLNSLYAGGGDPAAAYQATGSFCCELYAAAKSPFWLSPAYGADVFRVDVFWFGLNAGNPDQVYFPQFWDLLEEFSFRPHWGKYLPPASAKWRAYYREQLPQLEAFLRLRAAADPQQLFVTDYWREHLGITDA